MEKINARLQELFERYLDKSITEGEEIEFSSYIDDAVFSPQIQELLETAFLKENKPMILSPAGRDHLLKEILGESYQKQVSPYPERKPLKLWWRALAATAAAILIGVVALQVFHPFEDKASYLTMKNDVAPARRGAVLTLSTGKQIMLGGGSEGKLAQEVGTVITKTAEGQLEYAAGTTGIAGSEIINKLSTSKGETYQLILPDKSKVWLNAASSLKYPASFAGQGTRRVELEGEAYFEVSKDPKHPFIVESNGQSVQVLGTHFNINAYGKRSSTKTTLLEGAVHVTLSGDKGTAVSLSPGQQSDLGGDQLRVSNADTQQALDWVNGKFVFRDEQLESIMRRIALWYDLEVVIEGNVADLTYWGSVSRQTSLSDVLDYFGRTGNVKFHLEGKKIIVQRTN